MPTVTALLAQPRKRTNIHLFLDGEPAFDLHRKVAEEAGLFVGLDLSVEQVQELQQRNAYFRALDAAYRFLAHRTRSEAEVRTRLARGKIAPDLMEQVVAKLKQQRFLDDVEFARQWAERRAVQSPRSRAVVRWELRTKGVEAGVIEEVLESLDDDEAAHTAGQRKASRLTSRDYQEFRKLLWDFLMRRGFRYDVTGRAVERLWRELRPDPAPENDLAGTPEVQQRNEAANGRSS